MKRKRSDDREDDADVAGDDTIFRPSGFSVDELMEKRNAARAAKNWSLADKIRDKLTAMGFKTQDSSVSGVRTTLENMHNKGKKQKARLARLKRRKAEKVARKAAKESSRKGKGAMYAAAAAAK